MSPQHFVFVHNLKLDLELGVKKNKQHKFVLSPCFQKGRINLFGGAVATVYTDANLNIYSEGPDDLQGVGLGVNHKIYMINGVKENSKHGLYLSYGVSYLNSKVKYSTYEEEVVVTNDNVSTTLNSVSGIDTFKRYGFQTFFGDRILLNKFILEGYFGLGYTHTNTKSTSPKSRDYDRNIFDYGFTGIHPLMGVKIGFLLTK